ncbi:hypothetical protein RF11_13563 [Thelohanellus kitauei]|uniref:Uncharacterized protein n=1 Tax=Thelohanellus kitauei TaxID=669202 RepID=A0A0C2JKW3_THEKT|nr:hypothetical protein RF11_13563 [Thelohanellus kitauei]
MAKFELCYQCFLSRCYNHCTTFNFSESRVESAALVKFNVLCTLLVSAFFYQQGSLLHCDFISLFFFYTSQSIPESLLALICTVIIMPSLFKPQVIMKDSSLPLLVFTFKLWHVKLQIGYTDIKKNKRCAHRARMLARY